MQNFKSVLPKLIITCGMIALPALAQTPTKAVNHPTPGYHSSGNYVSKIKTDHAVVAARLAKKLARATPTPTPTPEPGPEKDGVWETASTYLITRINQLDIDTKIRQMKADGKTEYTGVAAFEAQGALFWNREIWRRFKHTEGEEAPVVNSLEDRTQGLQILPYKIGILSDGSASVSVALAGFRNQDPRHPFGGILRKKASFQVINNVPKFVLAADFLIFKWDDRYSQQNLSSRELKIGQVNFKYPLLQDDARVNVLALTAGGSIGFAQKTVGLADGRNLEIGSKANPTNGLGLNSDSQIGVKFSHYSDPDHGSALEIGVDLKNSRIKGAALDEKQPLYLEKVRQYTIEKRIWDAEIQQWLIDKKLFNDGGAYDGEYELFTGYQRPRTPSKPIATTLMTSTTLSPHMSFLFPLAHSNQPKYYRGSTLTKLPPMLGVSVGANLPLSNTIKGANPLGSSINESLADQMDLFHASVSISF
ncbi:MAG: hypothetical protein H7333_05885 [Bdellovibrionales bacterium]|nr:hypothetical protein [Oligoflexia bacterium]